MMRSTDSDIVRRALADVQDAFSLMNDEKDEQRLRDLYTEIEKRCKQIDGLRALCEDAENAAILVLKTAPALAFVFQFRADLIRAEIRGLRTDSLTNKVNELEKKRSWGKLIARVLNDVNLEALNGASTE